MTLDINPRSRVLSETLVSMVIYNSVKFDWNSINGKWFIAGTSRRADEWTDKWTDGQTVELIDNAISIKYCKLNRYYMYNVSLQNDQWIFLVRKSSFCSTSLTWFHIVSLVLLSRRHLDLTFPANQQTTFSDNNNVVFHHLFTGQSTAKICENLSCLLNKRIA